MRPATALFALSFIACGHSASSVVSRPLPVPGDAGAILLLGVELPEAGTVLGGHFGGSNVEVRQATYQLSEAARATWSSQARSRGEGVLRGAGYKVRSAATRTSDAQQLYGVQYGLSGHVQSIQIRTTGPIEPYRVEAVTDVAWELLDLGSGAAVFGRMMHATVRETGTLDVVVGQALDETLARLAADTSFLRAVASPREDPDAALPARFARPLPGPGDLITLTPEEQRPSEDADLVPRISAGIVTLHGPDNAYGTAFVLTRDGLAIASARSVRQGRRLRARLANGVDRPVRVLRSHAGLDVALIQIACPDECRTVSWDAPPGIDVHTNVIAVGAPPGDQAPTPVATGQVGGRWGIANGLTVVGFEDLVVGGEPVARSASGRVFGLVSARPGKTVVLMLDEVLRALKVRVGTS